RFMKKWLWLGLVVLVLVAVGVFLFEPTGVLLGWVSGESFFQGRPTRYWRKALRDRDADPAGYKQSLQALKAGGAAAVPVLVEILQAGGDPDWPATQVRATAANLLGEQGAERMETAGPPLVAALRDNTREVRAVAARSLEQLGYGGAEAVPLLVAMLPSDDCVQALRTLATYRDQARPALAPVIDLLGHPKGEGRWNGARTLGKIGPDARTAVPALIAQLKDDEAKVREHAAEALGDIGPDAKAAVPDLIRTLKDPDARVRRDAV